MTLEHMQTNTLDILNKISTSEQVASHPEIEHWKIFKAFASIQLLSLWSFKIIYK